MSRANLKEVMHPSMVLMRPLTRAFAFALAGGMAYLVFGPRHMVERIPPNYEEIRRLKGLPAIPTKHPGGFIKEFRIIPKEEYIDRDPK